MRLARWLRDPLSWLVVVSTLATLAIAGLLVSTLEPGLDQMVAQAPVDKPVEDLGEKLAEAESQAAPGAPPPTRPMAVAEPPAVAAEPPPRVRRAESEYRPPTPSEDGGEEMDDRRARRVRRSVEPVERGLRRQIRELEHLRDALEREQRQIRRHSEQDSRWDPNGHHMRQMRLAQLDIEIARVERDIRRLERGRPTLD